jgi:hypothetical protein
LKSGIKEKNLQIVGFAGFTALFEPFLKTLKILFFLFFRAFAEKEGFEPPDLLQSTVFKTAAFDRSAISPVCRNRFVIASANIVRFSDYKNFFGDFFKLIFKCLIISISEKEILEKLFQIV